MIGTVRGGLACFGGGVAGVVRSLGGGAGEAVADVCAGALALIRVRCVVRPVGGRAGVPVGGCWWRGELSMVGMAEGLWC